MWLCLVWLGSALWEQMKKYRDYFFLKAKQENYPARSVYKLKEMDARFHLFKPKMHVLDLGAAPGSWTLAAAERVGAEGRVLAADIKSTDTAFPANVSFWQEDVFERTPEFEAALAELAPFQVVISDMAPSTTGSKFTDQARSYNLCLEALAVACKYLTPGGSFVVKIFMGPDVQAYLLEMRRFFDKVQGFKPQSSRSESKEIFYLGLGFKGNI